MEVRASVPRQVLCGCGQGPDDPDRTPSDWSPAWPNDRFDPQGNLPGIAPSGLSPEQKYAWYAAIVKASGGAVSHDRTT
ncbi:MAG: hypothetical protein ACYCW6_13840, partial [Candidatus Xenobia bacterium]